MTLVASALAGGDCIDDADVLRFGSTGRVLGCVVKALSPDWGRCRYSADVGFAVWPASKATQPPRRPAQVKPRMSPAGSWLVPPLPLVLGAIISIVAVAAPPG